MIDTWTRSGSSPPAARSGAAAGLKPRALPTALGMDLRGGHKGVQWGKPSTLALTPSSSRRPSMSRHENRGRNGR